MSKILDSDNFGLKLYNRFPLKYREDDTIVGFTLKRYLEALADGGFKYSIDEVNGITSLVDPDTVPSDVLPILFKQYGLEVFNGIPEMYLRYLLPKLGEAWSQKGSLGVTEFITSSLSGIKTSTTITYDEQENPIVDVKLEMDYNIGNYFPDVEQFKRLLVNFIPFYCDINLIYSYMFYESQVISGKHSDTMSIEDTKTENGVFNTIEIDEYSTVYELKEEASTNMSDKSSKTNDVHCLLNNGFCLNEVRSYDIIRLVNMDYTEVQYN